MAKLKKDRNGRFQVIKNILENLDELENEIPDFEIDGGWEIILANLLGK